MQSDKLPLQQSSALELKSYTHQKESAREPVTLKLLEPFVKAHTYKKATSVRKFVARISPFLILIMLLYTLVPISYFTNTGSINNGWMLLGLLCFLAPNIILLDFALWNYFEGKKKAIIWSAETFFLPLSSTS